MWLVDDHDAFRETLAQTLSRRAGLHCARHFSGPEAALEALPQQTPPDVIVLDAHLRGALGMDAIGPLKTAAPDTRVLMLTTFYDHRVEAAALRAGADGFLLKSYSVAQIAAAIREAADRPVAAPAFTSATATATPAVPARAPERLPPWIRVLSGLRNWLADRGRRAAAAGAG